MISGSSPTDREVHKTGRCVRLVALVVKRFDEKNRYGGADALCAARESQNKRKLRYAIQTKKHEETKTLTHSSEKQNGNQEH
jgi:hypothetical protein